jgi:hypothetical protein
MSIVIDMNSCDVQEYFNIDSNGKKVIYIYIYIISISIIF